MYSNLASIIKFVQPCMAKYRKSHFWLAHPEDVIFNKKVLLQNTQGTIPVPLHYVEIGSKMQNIKPIHTNKHMRVMQVSNHLSPRTVCNLWIAANKELND